MSDNIKLAVAGLGGWGKNVLRAFGAASGAAVSALCDPDADRLAAAASHFPASSAVRDLDPILQDSSIDAVVLATPAEMHYSMARAALEAGKHVYVEKPLTLCAADAEDLVRIADRRGLKLMVGHLLEYHPAVERMKQLIDFGEIGEVRSIVTRRLNLGVVRRTENAFWSLAPHDVSVVLYLLGQEPDRVDAYGACFLQPGIEDTVVANLGFPGGQMANIHVSWLDPRKVREMVVVGTRKMLVFDETAENKLVIHDKWADARNGDVTLHNGEGVPVNLAAEQPLNIEAQHFVDAVRFDRTPRSDGQDGLRVVRILEEVDQLLRQCRRSEPAQ